MAKQCIGKKHVGSVEAPTHSCNQPCCQRIVAVAAGTADGALSIGRGQAMLGLPWLPQHRHHVGSWLRHESCHPPEHDDNTHHLLPGHCCPFTALPGHKGANLGTGIVSGRRLADSNGPSKAQHQPGAPACVGPLLVVIPIAAMHAVAIYRSAVLVFCDPCRNSGRCKPAAAAPMAGRRVAVMRSVRHVPVGTSGSVTVPMLA
jgi:hypothetical protein